MPWPQDAYVGQKVVCISHEGARERDVRVPEVNETCEISWVGAYLCYVLIELKGYPAPETTGWVRGFNADMFRPVQTKSTETGMAILRKILIRETIKEPLKAPDGLPVDFGAGD